MVLKSFNRKTDGKVSMVFQQVGELPKKRLW